VFEDIEYETMAKPEPQELSAFYTRQGHHEAAQSREKLKRMISHTHCFVTARCKGELIGFARGVTDGFGGRLAECKLDPTFQGPGCITRKDGRIEHDSAGIAHEMACRVIGVLRQSGVDRIVALAHGTEVDFCEELGFRKLRGLVALELTNDIPLPARELAQSAV